MSEHVVLAREYLAVASKSFWKWNAGERVFVWSNGATIAFQSEVRAVLARLAPHGLPPIGSVLLLLAACRESWWMNSKELTTVCGMIASLERQTYPEWMGQLLKRLDGVNLLPAELRTSTDAKAELAEVVFEGCPHRTSPSAAGAILKAMEEVPLAELVRPPRAGWKNWSKLLRELKTLRDGLEGVDLESLRLRQQTGLDQLVEPAELEWDSAGRARRLLGELENDEELAGLSRVARNLMAVVTLPRPVTDREDLPLGGVSDISNRGPLDRLLLSELANDDQTLMTRVALNEALYLRREAPPRSPRQNRSLLVDAGIRTWGVPRVFATAAALSLAATAGKHTRVNVWRPDGTSVVPVDLVSHDGLAAHLAALHTEPHPGGSLACWSTREKLSETAVDPVIVTTEEAAADPEFRRLLTALRLELVYLATVNREGRFRLIARSFRGVKILREAHLELNALTAPRSRPAKPLIEAEYDPDLPAILSCRPFPLRLPHPLDPIRTWPAGDRGVLAVTKDRRLLFWDEPHCGARQLSDTVPAGTVAWSEFDERRGISRAVVENASGKQLILLTVELAGGTCDVAALEAAGSHPTVVCSHGGYVFLIYRDPERWHQLPTTGKATAHAVGYRVDVHDLTTGERLKSQQLPAGVVWYNDRFFLGSDRCCYALSYDGFGACLEKAFDQDVIQSEQIVAYFDAVGYEGPLGFTRDGNLCVAGRDKPLRGMSATGLTGPFSVLRRSRDGNRLVLRDAKGLHWLFHVNSPHDPQVVREDARIAAEPVFRTYVHPFPLRHRFVGMTVDESHHLTLVSRRGHHWRIELDRGSKRLFLHRQNSWRGARLRERPFEKQPPPRDRGFSLHVATWNDGSRAFLDSRGLLHLQSADRSLPELSLVLHQDELAGWASDGRIFGPCYFTGNAKYTSATEVAVFLLEPFVRLLP